MAKSVVLVARDAPDIGELVRLVLEELVGVSAVVVRNPDEALRVARRSRPDLVIVDLQPPLFSAAAIARKLKSTRSTAVIPALGLVFYGEGRSEALEAGCDAILESPFDDLDRFLHKVQRYLSGRVGKAAKQAV